MATEAWTVRRLLEWTEDFLRKKGVEAPRLEAQILLAHALGCKKIDLYVRHEEEPPEDKRATFRDMIKKRAEGMPVAYLVGYRDFYSLDFAVTPAVLIPRPETETLVMEALRVVKAIDAPRVLDVGTGSGCIAVTIARQHKTARVTATDLSADALAVAGTNAQRHGVTDRVTFVQGDLFAPVSQGAFDLVVSNPPYIARAEFAALDAGVRDFEPRSALDGGIDGLDYYRRIANEVPRALRPGGTVLVEIGLTQEPAVRDLFAAQLEPGPTFKDRAGRPRVVSARLPR
ncbi:MAG TPA: peptide chain release factor N(5)-glutamine methyltransferase [Gemmataceae bacterium]|nr:peptide chain release factor N(5)-glutamine methyltransferase [Gemmataceae bacterium]